MTNGEEHEDKTEPVWEGTPETNKAGVWAIRIQCEEGEVTLGDAVEVHSRSGGHWPARVVEIERAWRGGCLAIVTPPAWSGEEYVGPEEQLALTRLRALKAERELRERTRMEAARKAVGACVDCGDRGQPCLCERAAAKRARHTADTLQAKREQQDRQAQIAERQRREDAERQRRKDRERAQANEAVARAESLLMEISDETILQWAREAPERPWTAVADRLEIGGAYARTRLRGRLKKLRPEVSERVRTLREQHLHEAWLKAERALPPPRRWERVWEHVRVAGGGTPSPRYRGTDGEARDQEEGEEVAEAVRRGRVQYRQVQEYLRHGGEEALEKLLALIREKA